jgi:AcrR family transcriptional regulator
MTIAEAAKGFGDGAANADPQSPVESSRRTVTLREACPLFAEHGYSRTTIREIAAAVGIQSGSLFYHFPTKEHILAAIIMESTLSGLAVARSFIAQAHSPVERFEALIRAHLSVLLEEHTGNAQRVSIS